MQPTRDGVPTGEVLINKDFQITEGKNDLTSTDLKIHQTCSKN